jgi:3-oxoadipate enol-lactonase
MTDLFVPVPGGRIHVVDEGRRGDPPVLLLHAGIVDLRAWDDVVPHLLAGGYRAVRRDGRGFGTTETDDVAFSNRADIIAILDQLAIGRAALVGNSQGGQIALDTAIEYPDRVVAVAAVAAGIGGFDAPVTPDELAAFDRMEALEEAIDGATGEARTALLRELLDLDTRIWVDGLGQSADRVPARIRDAVRAMNAEHGADGRVHGRPVPLDPAAATRLEALRCPVLAVAGALDVSDVPATARHLAATAPQARAVILPDVAHMIGMEAPDRLAELILEFLAPLPRWS